MSVSTQVAYGVYLTGTLMSFFFRDPSARTGRPCALRDPSSPLPESLLFMCLHATAYRGGPKGFHSLLGTKLLSRMLELRPALSGAWRGHVCALEVEDPVKKY